MSERPPPGEPNPAEPPREVDGVNAGVDDADESHARAMRALLKRSLARDVENAPDLLAGVQRRIRTRSKGKFYADGWSTTHARMNYVLIGLLTLVLVVLAYVVLSPIDVH
jgi:hypothetical protein